MNEHATSSDASYGVIPLHFHKGEWWILMVQHRQGHWAFPKGHPAEGETTYATACRELFEETQCRVLRFLDSHPYVETYQFKSQGQAVRKTVTYYIAEAVGDPTPQPEELRAATWVPLHEAHIKATFPVCRSMCQQVASWLNERQPSELPVKVGIRVEPWQ